MNAEIKEKIKNWILVIITAIACIFIIRSCNKGHESISIEQAHISAMDSMRKEINDKGQEITSTRLILSDYNIIKNKLHSSDSTILKLQAIIDKHTISATILNNSTRNKGTTATTTTKTEYVQKHDTVFAYPTYKTNWLDKWSKGIIIASKDSISRDFMVYNEFDIKQSYEHQGHGLGKYFRPRIPIVEVTNLNPMTQTTALKSFSLEPDKKGKRRTFVIGTIVGVVGYFFISKITAN